MAYKYSPTPAKAPKQPPKEKTEHLCVRCGRTYAVQKGFFHPSRSIIFSGNNGYLPVCCECVRALYEEYNALLGDKKAAVDRVCSKLDIYYSDALYEGMIDDDVEPADVMNTYITRSLVGRGNTRTYDDTLSDRRAAQKKADAKEERKKEEKINFLADKELIDFWGEGYTPSFYRSLQREFDSLCGGNAGLYQPAELIMIKDICRLQATIEKDNSEGRPIDKNVSALNTLIGSMNLKPAQQKDAGDDTGIELTPFGVWIRKIENTRPIAEPLDEWKDVDGIVKYITVWFFGHLCKMLKINNRYSRMYEEEIAKYTVNKPEYSGEDEDLIYDDIFERANAEEARREAEYEQKQIEDEFDEMLASEGDDDG